MEYSIRTLKIARDTLLQEKEVRLLSQLSFPLYMHISRLRKVRTSELTTAYHGLIAITLLMTTRT